VTVEQYVQQRVIKNWQPQAGVGNLVSQVVAGVLAGKLVNNTTEVVDDLPLPKRAPRPTPKRAAPNKKAYSKTVDGEYWGASHKDLPRGPGIRLHHGVMSAWMENHCAGYSAGEAQNGRIPVDDIRRFPVFSVREIQALFGGQFRLERKRGQVHIPSHRRMRTVFRSWSMWAGCAGWRTSV
jgi:hypothetical protein